MRQGPNGRRPRGRHHGGHGGAHNGGGGHRDHSGVGGNSGGNGNMGSPNMSNNRPRSASALRHQTFDSHCLDMRVRGNAWQVYEKYQSLGRDATSAGDRVAAENYLQHAEHYYRIIEAINEATALEQRQRGIVPGQPPAFGQQPDVPTNYYGQDGNMTQPQPAGAPQQAEGNNAGGQPHAQPQAEVTQQRPPQQTPFFTPEEAEEQGGGTEPLVARR